MKIDPVQRQSLLTLLSLTSVTAIGYISTMYFAHSLGPAIMGAYFTFLAYYGIFDLIGDGGFGGAAVKRISEGKEQNEYFTAYVTLRCLLLCISLIICTIIFPLLPDLQDSGLMPWMLAALVIGTVYSISTTDIYGTAQVGITQVSNFFNTSFKIIIQVAAVFIGFAVGGLVAGYIAGMVLSILINTRFLRLSFSRYKLTHVKALFTFSFWTFLSSGGSLIFSYADTILIGLFMTQGDVGVYRLAFQLASVSSIIVTAFHTTLYPRISQWHAENSLPRIETALSKALTYCLLLAIPITAGGILLSRQLMYFLYGESFISGADVLIILLFVQIANIFMFLFTMSLNAMDKPRDSFMVTSLSAVLNIFFNILLIPVLGIAGAACATLLTMTVNALLAYRILKPMVMLHVEKRTIFNIFAASGSMALVVFVYLKVFDVTSAFSLGIVILLGSLTYFAILFRLDHAVCDEVQDLMVSMDVPYVKNNR